jgi:CheY-like chemotaxis protein
MKKVLIVEDNEPVRKLLSKIVELLGYVSLGAGTGLEALQSAVSHRPDAILLDIALPDMDGRDVVRKIRANPATEHIRVIAFTGISDDCIGPSCVEAGCDDYLIKPVTYQILREKLQRIIR